MKCELRAKTGEHLKLYLFYLKYLVDYKIKLTDVKKKKQKMKIKQKLCFYHTKEP